MSCYFRSHSLHSSDGHMFFDMFFSAPLGFDIPILVAWKRYPSGRIRIVLSGGSGLYPFKPFELCDDIVFDSINSFIRHLEKCGFVFSRSSFYSLFGVEYRSGYGSL